MRMFYFNTFIGIIVLLWLIYLVQLIQSVQTSYSTKDSYEAFTPRINGFYRPYARHINKKFNDFSNKYNSEQLINRLKKWNIY